MFAQISPAIANHLWQSTLFAVVAGLLALALRKNRAQVRYSLWLAASLKFLIPFSVFVAAGTHLTPVVSAPMARSVFPGAVQEIGKTFVVPPVLVSSTGSGSTNLIPAILFGMWLCGFAAVLVRWSRNWLHIRAAVRRGTAAGVLGPVRIVSSPALLEPGIFGILRPVLLLPDSITQQLSPVHLDAILAHELCHARRRDNLAAAVHMLVEALFWFHPLVWWIGARLVEERERSCDEEVIRRGNQPDVYAESILKTCQFYVESPLACVSGITGSDLNKRIVRIMTQSIVARLDLRKKLLLSAVATLAIGLPLAIGLTNASQAPSFEVASIKPSDPSTRDMYIRFSPSGIYMAHGITVKSLIQNAYDLHDFQISGGPDWVNSARYDIVARASSDAPLDASTSKIRQQRLQALLADRFQFRFHRSTKELAIYALVATKNGANLQRAKEQDNNKSTMTMRSGELTSEALSMSLLAANLSNVVGRTVQDRTGLAGLYKVSLKWNPERAQTEFPAQSAAPDTENPSIFTAIQEQLGLKLVPKKGPVEILVIDQVERTPTEN